MSRKPLNFKRFILSLLGVFIFIFVFEMVFHGFILADTYKQTASLWRPEADMQSYMGWLTAGQFLMSVMFCYIYTFAAGGGIAEGARYGLYIGLLLASPNLIFYAVQPLPGSLVLTWIVGGLIEGVIAGVILSMIYRSGETT